MIYGRPSKVLTETASADLLDPNVDTDVKNVVNDLQDVLTTNVEEVPAEDKVSNHAVLSPDELKESCMLWEANGRICLDVRDLMRICEAEEDETGEAVDAGEIATDVAEINDVNPDDLVIVAPADVAKEMIESCLLEARVGRMGAATGKCCLLTNIINEVKDAGFTVMRVD